MPGFSVSYTTDEVLQLCKKKNPIEGALVLMIDEKPQYMLASLLHVSPTISIKLRSSCAQMDQYYHIPYGEKVDWWSRGAGMSWVWIPIGCIV